MSFFRRVLERMTLLRQLLLAGALALVLVAGGAHLWPHWGPLIWGLLGVGLLGLPALALGSRVSRALEQLAESARAITREEGTEQRQLVQCHQSRDLDEASAALRRAVDHLRERISALASRNAALGSQLQTRTDELSSLQDLSVGLAQQNDVGKLVGEALGALEQTMAFSSASVWARGDLDGRQPVALLGYRSSESELKDLGLEGLSGLRLSRSNLQRYEQIEREPTPIIENRPKQSLLSWLWEMVTDDARTSALYRSTRAWMAVPLKVRDNVLGVLRVDHAQPDYFTPERARLLTAVGSQTALAMRHAHLLARERDQAVTAERNRIARDLHDAVSQTLFAANLVAGALAKDPALDATASQQVQTLERLNRGALAEMRMLMFELRPDAIAGTRISELLQHATAALEARGGCTVVVQVDPIDPPPAQRMQAYRVAQEALSNVARHSGATQVQVTWALMAPQHGRLTVKDNGYGFDTSALHPGHFGLPNMRERAHILGSELQLESAPERGTSVVLDVKWPGNESNKL